MWIDKNIIPALIDAVELTITEELAAQALADVETDEHYDPNDIVIFDGFVLPVLQENIAFGFYSSEMLDKGFGFLIGLIQHYLDNHGSKLSDECFGQLAILHYKYGLKKSLEYIDYIEPKYIKENNNNINRYVTRALLTIEPNKASKI